MSGRGLKNGLVCLLAWGTAIPASASPCDATPYGLRVTVEEGLQAHAVWDWEGAASALAQVRHDRLCLDGVLSPGDVLRMHLLEALDHARARDVSATVAGLRGVLAIDPSFTVGEDLAARGSLLDDAFKVAAGVSEDPTQPLPVGAWAVDGRVGIMALPTARATYVQRIDPRTGLSTGAVYLSGQEGDDLVEIEALIPKTADSPPISLRAPSPTAWRPRAARQRTERRLDRNTEIGVDLGVPTGLRLGVHSSRWNSDGGFGVEGFGVLVGAPVPPILGVYLDLDLTQNWQLELMGDLWSLGLVGGGGGGAALQWDPPGRNIQAQIGMHAGVAVFCLFSCSGPYLYPAPDLRLGWTF